MTSVALWTDEKFFNQANAELNCDWKIFSINQGPSITAYLIVMSIIFHLKKKTLFALLITKYICKLLVRIGYLCKGRC